MSAETSQEDKSQNISASEQNISLSESPTSSASNASSDIIFIDSFLETMEVPLISAYMTLPSISPLKIERSFPTGESFSAAMDTENLFVPTSTVSDVVLPSSSRHRSPRSSPKEVKNILFPLSANIAKVRSCSPNPQSRYLKISIQELEEELSLLRRKQTLRELLQILPLDIEQQVGSRTGEAHLSSENPPVFETYMSSNRVLFSEGKRSKSQSNVNVKHSKGCIHSRQSTGNCLASNSSSPLPQNEMEGFTIHGSSRSSRLCMAENEWCTKKAELQALIHRDMLKDLADLILKEYADASAEVNFNRLIDYRICFAVMTEEDCKLQNDLKSLQSIKRESRTQLSLDRLCRLVAENQKYIAQMKRGFFIVNKHEEERKL